jgi:tripartite-type tricarboxylate transporter receptor subunit TctC
MKIRKQFAHRYRALALLLPVGLVAAGCAGEQQAEGQGAGASASSCYEGERLSFVVAYGEGGLYDLFARTAAPHLERELGATVVVENHPGAGGLTAANEIYAAEPDGLTIGFFSGQGLAGAVLGGSAGATFDLEEFTYVARLAQDDRLLVTGPESGISSVEDLEGGDRLAFASAGPGGADHIDATILIPVLGLEADIVTGYAGSAETALAVTSGDAQLASGTVPSRMASVESGDHVPVLVIAEERNERFPDVPALLELDLDDDQRALAEAHTSLQSVGVDVLGPPGVPEDCVGELEDAFEATLSDATFVADMEERYQPVEFTPGDELADVMTSVLKAPEEYRALLEGAYANQ